jgi:hypothetical protein
MVLPAELPSVVAERCCDAASVTVGSASKERAMVLSVSLPMVLPEVVGEVSLDFLSDRAARSCVGSVVFAGERDIGSRGGKNGRMTNWHGSQKDTCRTEDPESGKFSAFGGRSALAKKKTKELSSLPYE